MRKCISFQSPAVPALLTVLGLLRGAHGGSFTTDFNSGLPANSEVFGNAVISSSGGYTNSGCLQLTTAIPSQTGVFVVTNDLDAGIPVVSFTASYKVLIGGGNGADGMSFNFAPDLNLSGNWGTPEEGNGTGLTIEFDTFNNGGGDTAPAIDVKLFGAEYNSTIVQGLRTGVFVDAVVQLNPNNTLDVIYDGTYVHSNLDLSAYGYVPTGGSLFGIGARTGGSYDNHFVDNLSIVTMTNPAPYVQSFSPIGRHVATNSPIEILLADYVTQVDTNSLSLQLDNAPVVPTITTNGAGETLIHYVPPASFAFLSTHSVSLAFTDNATPSPNTNVLQYAFTVNSAPPVVGKYVTVFADGFETYVSGTAPLDKNYAGGANTAPNGSGNPWFGPAPPNARVVGFAETSVNPHSGTNMLQGSAPNDLDENWFNISYRLRGGNVVRGNVMLDWWFYDPLGPGGSSLKDYVALGFYNLAPTNTDYPGTGSLNSSTQIQRISLGASSNQGTGYDSNKYQSRVVGGTGYVSGWNNTSTTRSIGWHHARIIAGSPLFDGTCNIDFYIDDITTPTFSQNSATTYGFNVIEINTGYGTTFGYFDDVTFALAVPADITATQSGNNVILTWSGGFTLQSAPRSTGAYSDVPGATSPYAYDASTTPQQFFRLRN